MKRKRKNSGDKLNDKVDKKHNNIAPKSHIQMGSNIFDANN